MLDISTVLNSINAKETIYPFRPVRCKEEEMLEREPVEGFLYFTLDTKKIFQVINGKYVLMGGSSGIYYGQRQLTDDEKYGDDPFLDFTPEDIDGDIIPSIDDLILNIPDGGFYRVLESSEVLIETQRLAMAGGGGGGTGGGGTSNEGSLVINFVTPQYSSTITGVDYYIEFDITAKDSAGDNITEEGNATWRINGVEYTQKVKTGRNKFKVSQYLDSTIEQNKLILIVSMNTGGVNNSVVSKTWYVKAINLALDWPWTYSEQEYRSGDTFTLKFIPYGNVDCVAHIIFDNSFEEGITYFTENISSSRTGKEYTTSPMPSLTYGAHTCEMYLTATINGEPHQTPSIFHEITFTKGGTSTILTVPYYTVSATQYDTLSIPFLVYDPDLEKCPVSFYVNNIRVAGDSYDRELQYWPYTLTESGTVKLTIKTDNNEAYKDIEIIVNALDLDITEATGATFSLKASNFSSNEEIRNWNSNGVTLEFSDNFDWKNGGLKFETMPDGSVEKYINVRQGTRMTIKYKLFENFVTGSTGGKNFKFCFKATNCYDYEAPVLECYELLNANTGAGLGIRFDAQKARFETPANTGFATQYYENSYIEIETEIWPNVGDIPIGNTTEKLPGDRFIMIWVDGVPAGVKPYSQNETLTQTQAKEIVIGSDLCDVYVYVAKAYERKLSEDEHLNNFIMDAPSAIKMMDRYRRNDILDNRGEISYEKLVANNPNCRAYLYEVPHVTTEKDDKVEGCNYYELWKEYNTLDKPYYKGEDTITYVQGTSSAAYGVAAFNLRSDFTKKGKIYDKDGKEVTGWKVAEDAIPVAIACTKVNVASSENVNNVVNQEWYNRFQPYHDAHRRKTHPDGLTYRDTMQFETGVVFIKDNNPKTEYYNDEGKPDRDGYLNANTFLDTPGYTSAPYYKQYAIGNMGNDKKNVEVFHDLDNPWACCIEVTDNQNAEHWMTVPTNMAQFDLEKPFYEFRYPDGNDKATTAQKQAWIDFVNWMAASNPKGGKDEHILKAKVKELTNETYKKNVYFILNNDGYYEKALNDFESGTVYYEITAGPKVEGETEIGVIFGNYTYKGFDAPGFEGEDNPTGISLKGIVEKTYSTTKVIETPKLDSDGNPVLDENGEFVMESIYSTIPYTHDTFEYRMAKMLSECDDHLVMDSVVYHYLFIQRHTMVDNVAKNTFWSTEDGIHWDLTKDYDNDTSDGNNNSGYLTFTYGIECLDKNPDGSDIFNASDSVWINFIYGLPEAQKYLHQQLEGIGAWDAKAYLAECERHQSIIPERCWIYDYIRKYIRPRRLGLDSNTYLERLEGGKKTHQRAQYETYQQYFLNSKYVAGSAFSQGTAADLRLNKDPNGVWDSANVLPMSFYIDCYSTIYLGGQLKTSERLKRGEIWNAPVGEMIGSPNDATCYIFGPSMLQTISGLHKLYPFYATLNTAGKLREVAFGSKEEGYYNSRLKAPDIGSNAMLQKVQIQNSGIESGLGSLILTQAYQLKELYLSGSTTNELELADGSTVEILELNPLTTLTLSNLTDLKTVTMDEGIYDSITNIYVTNCPELDQYTYKFAKNENLNKYQLNDFQWTISSTGEDYDLAQDFVLDESNKVIGIAVLENLTDENTSPKDGTTTTTALIGTITVNVPCTIDEFEIYNLYCKTYPNLIIKYSDIVGEGLNPAVELIFYTNANAIEQHYRVLGSGDSEGDNAIDIATLISAEGPLGKAMATPHRDSTIENTFTFTGYWIDQATNKKYYNPIDFAEGDEIEEGATSFADVIPTVNMTFIPEYIEELRKYKVKFYDYDRSIIPQGDKEEWLVDYGTIYNGPIKNYYYRNSSDLIESMRWAFQGWTLNYYGDTEVKDPVFINLEDLTIEGDVNLYAYYVQEDVYKVATKEEYFNFTLLTNYIYEKGDSQSDPITGYDISVKPEYAELLQGKITLPVQYDNLPIIRIGNFVYDMPTGKMAYDNSNNYVEETQPTDINFTHLFVLDSEETNYKVVASTAFESERVRYFKSSPEAEEQYSMQSNTSKIEKVYLPNSIELIEFTSFKNSKNLVYISLSDNIKEIGGSAFAFCTSLVLDKLPDSLIELGAAAFQSCGEDLKITKLPENLKMISSHVFYNCINVKVDEFGENKNLTSIGQNAFSEAGKGENLSNSSVQTLKILSKMDIGNSAFSNYGNYNALVLKGYTVDEEGGSFVQRIMGNSFNKIKDNIQYLEG